MTFPMISYRATNTQLDETLQNLIEQKFQSLERYIGNETDVRCEVEFERVSPQQHTGNVYRVEVNLFLKGKLHRAEATEVSFETAIDTVRSELDTELQRASEKRGTLIMRGARKFKNMLRFGS